MQVRGQGHESLLSPTACSSCVLASYMPQEDRLNAALTVYENLDFALRLSDASLTCEQRRLVS